MLNKFYEELKSRAELLGTNAVYEYWQDERHNYTVEFDCYGDVRAIVQNW